MLFRGFLLSMIFNWHPTIEFIYVGWGRKYLGVINNPNQRGQLADYIDDGIFLNSTEIQTVGLQTLVVIPTPSRTNPTLLKRHNHMHI